MPWEKKTFRNFSSQRGQFASFDAFVWLLVMIGTFLLMLQWSGQWMQEQQNSFESNELERNALMVMDSLIKNRDTKNPQYGSAMLDTGKKRVKSNQLEKQLLEKIPEAQEKESAPVFFQKIELLFENGKRETVFELPKKGKCLSVERFGIVENQKVRIQGTVCHE
jgi:hypothetical protein